MTTYRTPKEGGRVHFGALAVTPSPSPQEDAINAMGRAVPGLEAALGFPVSMTAEAKEDGLIWVMVLLPDDHYNGQNSERIGAALWEAARPFTQLVHIETDSAAPYAE